MKSKFHKITLALVASILVFFLVHESTAALQYIVSDLGDGIAMDINNNGQVVGTWEPDPQGLQQNFYWDSIRGRESIDLGGHGGFLGINDVGEAIQLNWFHPPKGRIWNSTTEEVEVIPIFPKAINDSAYVTGWTGGGPGGGDLAVVWDDTNGIQPIAGGINGEGYDVNDYGEVIGRYSDSGQLIGFIWDSSNGLRNIPTLGGDWTEANAINNLAQVVGNSRTSSQTHAFIWDEFNGIRDLGTLEYCPAETDNSNANGINILGQVVGRSCAISAERPQGQNAVLWVENNVMIDLNTLIPADSGWVLDAAYAINDSGRIVGRGTLNGEEQRAFLLTPIPYVDIIPRSCPNECPIKGGKSLTVAILGTAGFNVNAINMASIQLEEVAPVQISLKDKSTPPSNPENECDCTSEGRDGFIDLCLKFDKEAIFDALGGVSVDDSFVLKLTANLNDGTPIEGYDCIDIVKAGKGKKD